MSPTLLEAILVSIIASVFVTLLIDNAYIRFKTERSIRKILGKSLLSFRLNTRPVFCKNGLILLHGVSIKNKMWFTHKLPKNFCNSPTTLNWRGPCNYFTNKFFKIVSTEEIKEVFNKYLDCVLNSTSDPGKRDMDIYKETESTVEVITESIELNIGKPLNTIKKIGGLHLGSRNLMPILKPGYEMTIKVISKEFGIIDEFKIKVPDDLQNRKPISNLRGLHDKENLPLLLSDIGVPKLRWPIRFEIVDDC